MDLLRAIAPRRTAHAHCDIPCGIYDPVQARIEELVGGEAEENAQEARKYAGPNLTIIPVTSFEQALRALDALPPAP